MKEFIEPKSVVFALGLTKNDPPIVALACTQKCYKRLLKIRDEMREDDSLDGCIIADFTQEIRRRYYRRFEEQFA